MRTPRAGEVIRRLRHLLTNGDMPRQTINVNEAMFRHAQL